VVTADDGRSFWASGEPGGRPGRRGARKVAMTSYVLVDEPAREELLDDLGGELGARGPVEAVEGEGRAELAPAAAALELALPAGAVLGFEDLG
jgi:hypothetical protein